MKTVEEIKELSEKRYGTNPNSFGGQRDGFKEGFKQAQEMQLLQSCVSGSLLYANMPMCNKNGTGTYCSKCGDVTNCNDR